jgi:hypothetical protein
VADPYWANVQLLLHCDGSEGSTTFTDSSAASQSVSPVYGADIDASLKRYGTGSLRCDAGGSGLGYLYCAPEGDNLEDNLFCIEGSIYINTFDTSDNTLFYGSGIFLWIDPDGYYKAEVYDASRTELVIYSSTSTIASGGWHDWALTWDGSTLRGYLDGTLEFSTEDFTAFDDDGPWTIGGGSGDGTHHIDEVRITVSVARYTGASYTPEGAAFEEGGSSSSEEGAGTATIAVGAAGVGSRTAAGAWSASIAATATANGRGLPYGEATIAIAATAVGSRTQGAAASAACAVSAASIGGSLWFLPIVINRILTVRVGLPIRIHRETAVATVTLPIHLGTYPVTATLPIRIDVPTAVATVSLPIRIYGDQSTATTATIVGWRPLVTIGATDISSKLIAAIEIEYEEMASPIARLAFLPAAGSVDPLAYVGSSVVIQWQRLVNGTPTVTVLCFTGVVSDPTWDADNRVLSISATGDMQARYDRLTKAEIDAVLAAHSPQFSEYVFGPAEDLSGWEYAQALISTTDAVLWMDVVGTLRSTSTLAKVSADYIFTEADLIAGSLGDSPRWPSRQEMTNQLVVTMQYRYRRRRQRHIAVTFRDAADLDQPSTYLSGNYGGWKLPQRSQVESAATSGGWTVIGDITYTDVWPSGTYSTYSDSGDSMYTGWLNVPEVTKDLCIGARWTAARRWLQTVTETATLTLNATESQGVIGILADAESYAIEDEADDETWESSLEYDDYVSGATLMSNGIDKRSDLDTLRTAFETAQECALAKARGDILRAHRGTTVTVSAPFVASLDLSHTAEIDTTYLQCQGKVARIQHRFDLDSGDALTTFDLALYRHNGSGLTVDDALDAVDKADDPDETAPTRRIDFGLFIGGQDNLPKWSTVKDESGYFVNVPFDATYGSATIIGSWQRNPLNPDVATRIYEEGFALKYPDIDSSYADPTNAAAVATYEVAIPEDSLVIVSG